MRDDIAFLEGRTHRVLVATDEFQQIREYPEKNTEALLRTCTQHFNNVSFIFCGSRKHVMKKGLILDTVEKENTSYRVYDVFLMRWLQNTY